MNNFAIVLQNSLFKEFDIEVDAFLSRKRLLHIGFEKALSSYQFYDELLKFVKFLWEHPLNTVEGYKTIFPRPTNERKMFYYIFFQKKKNVN